MPTPLVMSRVGLLDPSIPHQSCLLLYHSNKKGAVPSSFSLPKNFPAPETAK